MVTSFLGCANGYEMNVRPRPNFCIRGSKPQAPASRVFAEKFRQAWLMEGQHASGKLFNFFRVCIYTYYLKTELRHAGCMCGSQISCSNDADSQ